MKKEKIKVSVGLIDSLKKDEERRAALLKAKPAPSRNWLKGVWGIPAISMAGTVCVGMVLFFVFKEGGAQKGAGIDARTEADIQSLLKPETRVPVPLQNPIREESDATNIPKDVVSEPLQQGDAPKTVTDESKEEAPKPVGVVPAEMTALQRAQWRQIDKDRDGRITLEELQAKQQRKKRVPDLFRAVDKDNDGFISKSEFTVLTGPVLDLTIMKTQ